MNKYYNNKWNSLKNLLEVLKKGSLGLLTICFIVLGVIMEFAVPLLGLYAIDNGIKALIIICFIYSILYIFNGLQRGEFISLLVFFLILYLPARNNEYSNPVIFSLVLLPLADSCYTFAGFILTIILGIFSKKEFDKNKEEQEIKEYEKQFFEKLKKKNEEDTKNDIINELCNKSNLSFQICSDVYEILNCFNQNNRELAYRYIDELLIPDIKSEGLIGKAGIAFGMLVDEKGITQEESVEYAKKVIDEILNDKD